MDSKTDLQSHLDGLCSKASRKLHALARIAPYMDLRKILIHAFLIVSLTIVHLYGCVIAVHLITK